MNNVIKDILANEGIFRVGILPLSECDIINARILPEWTKSVVIVCIPYRSVITEPTDGFSEYARIYDYHKYSKSLYDRVITTMEAETKHSFSGFCDHSPINEKLAAAKCGLGVIGKNSLFIDDRYGSFVFLGSIMTDMESQNNVHEIRHCEDCGLCKAACPNNAIKDFGIDRNLCLSGISQKKNKSVEERELLKANNIVWGCDICQNVCPHNASAEISPIPYFKETRIPYITRDYIISLTDEEFERYAFSYKGRKIVINNIDFT